MSKTFYRETCSEEISWGNVGVEWGITLNWTVASRV